MVGLVLGAVVAATVILRYRSDPDAPAADPQALALPEAGLARRLLDLMDPAVVFVDVDDAVLLANPAARALGVVRGTRLLVPDLVELSREVRARGSRRADVRLPGDLAGAGPRLLGVHGVRLGSGTTPPPGPVALVLVDVTETRRVEAVRRDFVANVGHELKTPVGALALLAEAIEGAADDPEAVQRFAGRMAHEADRLGRLVRELIDLSRLQGGEPLPELEPVDVDTVLAEAVDRTRTAAVAKQLDIAVGGEKRPGRARRREPARHRRHQPARQRRRLQPGGDPHRGRRPRAVRVRRDHGDRQRHRHPAQGPAAGVRALLPGRPVPGQQHRRHRAGAGDRQARGQQPRRLGERLERGGSRFDLHAADPAATRRATAPARCVRRCCRRGHS